MASSDRSCSLAELAELVAGEVRGNPERLVHGLAPVETAGQRELSFVTNPRYRKRALESAAGALLVGPELADLERDLLVSEEPYWALTLLIDRLYPAPERPTGLHPTAVVDESAVVDPSASIGPYATVGAGTRIEAGAVLHSHVTVGRDCRIGADTVLFPQVVLYDETEVGSGCSLHSGVILGCDGFGYATRDGEHYKLRHVGRVVIEDGVEIGSNSVVDRALFEETRIGAGTKIDNLVQIGHNARVGRSCLLVSQTGISGSTSLGDGVVMGGQTGAAGHLTIGDGVQVGAKSAVLQDVEAGASVAGIPAIEMSAWRKQQAIARRLGEFRSRLLRLERRLGPEQGDEDE